MSGAQNRAKKKQNYKDSMKGQSSMDSVPTTSSENITSDAVGELVDPFRCSNEKTMSDGSSIRQISEEIVSCSLINENSDSSTDQIDIAEEILVLQSSSIQ